MTLKVPGLELVASGFPSAPGGRRREEKTGDIAVTSRIQSWKMEKPTRKINRAKRLKIESIYKKQWETIPECEGWLKPVTNMPTRAFCSYCKVVMRAHRVTLLCQASSYKHKQLAPPCQENISPLVTETKVSDQESERKKRNDREEEDTNLVSQIIKKCKTLSTQILQSVTGVVGYARNVEQNDGSTEVNDDIPSKSQELENE